MRSGGIVRLVAAVLAVTLMHWSTTTAAQEAVKPTSRAEATKIIADLRKIVTPEGIERLETVRIGGIDQWVSIRGTDRRNPILLMIHGGPGFPAMPTSWYFARGWEEYFTVVQWDQRGGGKTYTTNGPEKIAPTMTRERMIADAEEMVAWLRREFGKDKVFVLGHSWGSYVGLSLAQKRPEWLHAYIGVGQISNARESERRSWRFTMEQAQKTGNAQAVRELQAIAPYGEGSAPIPLEHLYLQRKWLSFFGGYIYGRTSGDFEAAAIKLSPEYSDADVRQIWTGNEFSEGKLLAEVVSLDMSSVKELGTPLILFNGRHDHNVSAELAAEWFGRVKAPAKSLVWFEHSGHEVMIEEPGKMLVELVRLARPIAERAGDVPR